MANTFLTNAAISYRTLDVLMNNLRFVGSIDRQYSSEFAVAGAQIGNQIHIRKPPRYIVGDGPVIVPQDTTETYVTLTLNYHKNLAMNWTSEDATLSMDDFENRIIKPAATQLANEIDRICLEEVIWQVFNVKGTPGALPNDSQIFLEAKARMLDEACPMDMPWQVLLSARSEASMVKALQGLYNSQVIIGEQYRRGRMKEALGFDWDVDQNMPTNVVGALGGTPAVAAGATQTGTTLLTSGWTATTGKILKGNKFTIAGVYAVNPLSRRSTGELRDFTAAADATADGSGNMSITLTQPITPPDAQGNPVQFQTTTSGAVAGSLLTVLGSANTSSPQNLAYHPKFATFGCADLVPPSVGEWYRLNSPELGLAFRVWKSSDWKTDTHGVRMDVLFGIVPTYTSWACRVAA